MFPWKEKRVIDIGKTDLKYMAYTKRLKVRREQGLKYEKMPEMWKRKCG